MLLHNILMVIHVLVAIGLIGLILLQQGKGADAGAAFGGGASGTVFGAQGSSNFMSRLTAILATSFFVLSLSLAYLTKQAVEPASDTQKEMQEQLEKDNQTSLPAGEGEAESKSAPQNELPAAEPDKTESKAEQPAESSLPVGE